VQIAGIPSRHTELIDLMRSKLPERLRQVVIVAGFVLFSGVGLVGFLLTETSVFRPRLPTHNPNARSRLRMITSLTSGI